MIKTIWRVLSDIISWLTLAALLFCIAGLLITKISNGVPEIFGYRLFVIATGSMAPTLEVGDVILSKSFNTGDDLDGNEILTYNGSGETEGHLITHRLISTEGEPGLRTLVLRGDANDISDSDIGEDRVIAKMVCKLRIFGFVYSLMQSKFGMPVLIIIILFFIIKEILEFRKNVTKAKETVADVEKKEEDNSKNKRKEESR